MTLAKLYTLKGNKISGLEKTPDEAEKELVRLAMWASEPIAFDPMEIALHEAYSKIFLVDERPDYKMIHEYALGGTPHDDALIRK